MIVTRDAISAARGIIAGFAYRTPVLEIDGASLGVDVELAWLKLEYLQPPGSFKARGAAYNLLSLDVPDSGVVAASGGNHGVAVAWAADRLGVPAHIFVPEISAPAKVKRLRDFGAHVHQVGAVYAEAHEAAVEHQALTGALSVHPYDSTVTITGAGTIGAELEEQCPKVDTVLLAIGGGGLAAGAAAWFGDAVELVLVEGTSTPTWRAAHDAGRPAPISPSGVTADALGATEIGGTNFDILRAARTRSVLVSDEAVIEARAHMWRTHRIAVEHAAAVTVAALRSGEYRPDPDERIAVVLCGANTDPATLEEIPAPVSDEPSDLVP